MADEFSSTVGDYDHTDYAGGHGDVIKHVVYRALIIEMQKQHKGGLLLVDCHAGHGLYDLSEQETGEYERGIMRINSNMEDAPQVVQNYFETVKMVDDYMQLYPGSPVFGEKLLRSVDEQLLFDLNIEDVDGLDFEPNFTRLDSFEPESLDFILPICEKHPVVLIDPPYKDPEDFYRAKLLMERILQRDPGATIMVWFPLIKDHRYRWGYHKKMKESAEKLTKTGHYSASVTVQKDGMQGSVVFIANPTKDFDDIINEEVIDWLSAVLVTSGRSDFVVDQYIKKKKKKKQPPAEAAPEQAPQH